MTYLKLVGNNVEVFKLQKRQSLLTEEEQKEWELIQSEPGALERLFVEVVQLRRSWRQLEKSVDRMKADSGRYLL